MGDDLNTGTREYGAAQQPYNQLVGKPTLWPADGLRVQVRIITVQCPVYWLELTYDRVIGQTLVQGEHRSRPQPSGASYVRRLPREICSTASECAVIGHRWHKKPANGG